MNLTNRLRRARDLDQRRPSMPGEHWMTFATGLYFLLRRRPTVLGRLASMAMGGAAVARALSGRDGAIQMYKRVQQRQGR